MVINKISTKKSPGPDGFNTEFYQKFQGKLISILLKVFYITDSEETMSNSFYEVTVTLIPKPQKDSTKEEYYRPISLMNMNAKIMNKILPIQIQEHIKNTT